MARKKKGGIVSTIRGFDFDTYFALGAGVLISAISAYYSVVGLAAIFPGAGVAIYYMGAALEIGKVITASYLYRNWKSLHILMKVYFTVAVIILMGVTSMGTFGFLSKAHIEHTSMSASTTIRVEQINSSIERENRRVAAAQRQLDQLDAAINTMIDNDRASRALEARRLQESDRSRLEGEISNAQDSIEQLVRQREPYEREINRVAQEVGPIRYVAETIYGRSDAELLEKAVRWMIIILVIVFDPLAVLLIMVSTRYKEDRSIVVPKPTKYDKEAKAWLGSKSTKAVATDGTEWKDMDINIQPRNDEEAASPLRRVR